MALTPREFYAHALAAADEEGRLPLARMTEWDISPFQQDGLQVTPLREPAPERPRYGEGGVDCGTCAKRDAGIWFTDSWRLARIGDVGSPLVLMLYPRDHYDFADLSDELAAEAGVLSVQIARHVEAVANIARCHVYRIGDGGAHLHLWFFGRPAGQVQFFGSWLPVWDDLLPTYPEDVAEADAQLVVNALLESYGGRRTP
ncbi:MAG TPA: hypothetical protein VGL26_07645 [Jatrophihabitans sp.]|jgi:hypothetical protein